MSTEQFEFDVDYDRGVYLCCTACGWNSENDGKHVNTLTQANLLADAHVCQ